jgi:hypothetical protein
MIKLLKCIVAASLTYLVWIGPLQATEADWQWSGHLRGSIFLDYYDEENFLAQTRGEQLFLNGAADGRLNSSFYLGEFTSFNIDYEVVASGGQTRDT